MDVPVIGHVNAWVLAVGVVGAVLGMLFVTTLFTRKTPRKSNMPPEPFAFGTTLEQRGAHRRKGNPIGVAEYQLQTKLPAELKGKLPSPKQLQDLVRDVLPDLEGD